MKAEALECKPTRLKIKQEEGLVRAIDKIIVDVSCDSELDLVPPKVTAVDTCCLSEIEPLQILVNNQELKI